jgi:hypothetical protein
MPTTQWAPEAGTQQDEDLSGTINDAVAAAVQSNPESLNILESWVVEPDVLTDSVRFHRWCTANGKKKPPVFSVQLQMKASAIDSRLLLVTITLVNRSTEDDILSRSEYWDLAIFDPGIEVAVAQSGRFVPMDLWALPKSYRFDRQIPGVGVNCCCDASEDRRRIWTVTVPIHRQATLNHRKLDGVDLTFAGLGEDPVPSLTEIATAMEQFRLTEWRETRSKTSRLSDGEVLLRDFAVDLADFETECAEFRAGLALLKTPKYGALLRAFMLMNRSFDRVNKAKDWRLFQIVFVVRNLVALAAREWPEVETNEDVEILWFPTGGGKTEAFLGLILTALFFDRLRDRKRGTTAVIRLPLRLLSLQQFQRVVDAVAAADIVRQEELSPNGGKPFSVGHWIGKESSPNLVKPDDVRRWKSSPKELAKYQKIRRCPYCGSSVTLSFDERYWAIVHRCDAACRYDGRLPLFIVDDEIYRFLPSVVVGTVDKLAALGFQQRFANLLGSPGAYCPQHGFSPQSRCLVQNCNATMKPYHLKDPVPSLHVQDELHLLKEDLGTFDGHYETAVLGIQELIPHGKRWKTIAATATIEKFEWQAAHLYCSKARRFPAAGPRMGESFYSVTEDRVSRVFLGILPFSRSHINAMVSVLWIYHRAVIQMRLAASKSKDAFNELTGISVDTVSRDEIQQAVRDYELSLTYVLTRKSGDQMAESINTQIAGYLRDLNEAPLNCDSLTGQTLAHEIESIMKRIDDSGTRPVGDEPHIDAIIATSMISHGVDVERFNFMGFFGMPRMTAEYIQASSRVARAHPGLACVVFSPSRERDRSHYHIFDKYHEYLERLVEPAAINRWARHSATYTLPGIFIGFLLAILGRKTNRRMYIEKEVHAALNTDGLISSVELIDAIKGLYAISDDEHPDIARQIEHEIEQFLNGLNPHAKRMIWKSIKPMYSLRDVEDPVEFFASNRSSKAFDMWIAERRLTRGHK